MFLTPVAEARQTKYNEIVKKSPRGAAAEEHQLDKGRKDGGRGTGYCRDSAGSHVSIRVAPLKKTAPAPSREISSGSESERGLKRLKQRASERASASSFLLFCGDATSPFENINYRVFPGGLLRRWRQKAQRETETDRERRERKRKMCSYDVLPEERGLNVK